MDLKKELSGVAEAAAKIMDEQLKGQQHQIDKNKNNKIDAHDFAILRGEKKAVKKEEVERIEEVSFDMPWGLSIRGGTIKNLDQLLAQKNMTG